MAELKTKIPKIIHYFYDDINIWAKNSNSSFRMCYASWCKNCPDYEIKLWHPGMPEFKEILKKSAFVRRCYELKLWAFVADYIRHYVCYNYGGIYLDTDVQVLKNFDDFLNNDFFCSIEGDLIENENIPETAVMGAVKGHPLLKEVLDFYDSDEIYKIDYPIDPIIFKLFLSKRGKFKAINYANDELTRRASDFYKDNKNWQLTDYELYRGERIWANDDIKVSIYPSEYFCPPWTAFGMEAFTDNTVCIHWNQSSWWGKEDKIKKLKSHRYKSFIKRRIYLEPDRTAKLLTWYIPNKKLRRHLREVIKNQI